MIFRLFYVPLQAKPTIMQHTNTPNTVELDINRVLIANASMPYEKKMLQLVGGDVGGKLFVTLQKNIKADENNQNSLHMLPTARFAAP